MNGTSRLDSTCKERASVTETGKDAAFRRLSLKDQPAGTKVAGRGVKSDS